MCGLRHADIFEEMFHLGIEYDKNTYETGFMTDDYKFLNRHDAIDEAIVSGQISKDFKGFELYSEDIWPE